MAETNSGTAPDIGPVETQSSVPLHNTDAFKRKVDTLSAEHKESVARWGKDHPTQEPGTSTRTWKSFSNIRFTSPAYREGWEVIFGKDMQ